MSRQSQLEAIECVEGRASYSPIGRGEENSIIYLFDLQLVAFIGARPVIGEWLRPREFMVG